MAISLGGLIIDRIVSAVGEAITTGDLLYTLTQLSEASIDISADSKDAVDKDGILVKRFYTSKSGTFTATNAFVDFNILASQAGNDIEFGTEDESLTVPYVATVNKSTRQVQVSGLVSGTVRVIGVGTNGAKINGKDYVLNTTANATNFSISGETITLPTDDSVANFVIKCDRKASDAAKLVNSADKFPENIKLTLKALAVDECNPDVVRAVYIVFPSFMPSPETSLAISTDANLDYSGDLQAAYCSDGGKVLYEIYYVDEE